MLDSEHNHIMADIYTKPWCRIGAYMIGMMTGYFMHITKNQLKFNKVSSKPWLLKAFIKIKAAYTINIGVPIIMNRLFFVDYERN